MTLVTSSVFKVLCRYPHKEEQWRRYEQKRLWILKIMINQAPAVSLCKTTEQFSCAVTGLYKYMKDVQDEGKEKQSTSEARMS